MDVSLPSAGAWRRAVRCVERAEERGYGTADDQLICLEFMSEAWRGAGIEPELKLKYAPLAVHMIKRCVVDHSVSQEQRFATHLLAKMVFVDFDNQAHPIVLSSLLGRRHPAVARWRYAVLKRDGHACRHCGSKQELHAHHIERWIDAPSLRTEVSNGLTLCAPCHKEVHHGKPH